MKPGKRNIKRRHLQTASVRAQHVVRDGSTYLTTNDIKLVMTNINCLCDGVNPTIVKFRVVKGHDRLYARPDIVFWVDS
jgi:hypothetical protein